ncbi:I78 family peptidase inhibitor [Novosphingobium sp. 9U]|uniref:I78 family peptidase inhibitor n=1 Tax=Novosphingobium sp. 9U TaxID=2653158 RepID=UPI0012EF2682|nr:I78 family peptidase inhibitor [Novosphingobium sp. 9U]VWX52149.1 conserved hypothetical protein [Novosphingobium sp. 9U]
MAALATLAGCAAQGEARPEPASTSPRPPLPGAPPPPPPPPAPVGSDACGASKVASYIGVQRTDEVIAKIKSASGAQALRVVGPHDAMTMDFREDRLTVTTDEAGRIKTLRCV